MIDIYIGIALIIAASIIFFCFTVLVAKRLPQWAMTLHAIIVILGIVAYVRFFWDKAYITWFVPYSNAIVVGNWFPVFTAILSGLIYLQIDESARFRKWSFVMLLNLVGTYAMLQPILGVTPQCDNHVNSEGVAIQSSQVSCSPTSAVNLLRFYGITTNEEEMARLCFTRQKISWLGFDLSSGGTSWIGLYRGLKIKLKGTGFEPHFISMDVDTFLNTVLPPVEISLKLKSDLQQREPARFRRLYEAGWRPEVEHNVVLIGKSAGWVEVLDPNAGREKLLLSDFRELFVGRGILIEERG